MATRKKNTTVGKKRASTRARSKKKKTSVRRRVKGKKNTSPKRKATTKKKTSRKEEEIDVLLPLFAHKGIPRVMRFLLSRLEESVSFDVLKEQTRLTTASLQSCLDTLEKVGFLKKLGGGKNAPWEHNKTFPHTEVFRELLFHPRAFHGKEVLKKIAPAGSFRLVVLGGALAGDEDREAVDMLLVGERINEGKLATALAMLEAELGKELSFALMNTKEFHYRLSMYDKLLRLVLEGRHEKLVNRFDI